MKIYLLIVLFFFSIKQLIAEEVVIYAIESAQYLANDCCTFNYVESHNGDIIGSQECQDMGAYYGCGMAKIAPIWRFDLTSLSDDVIVHYVTLKGYVLDEPWPDVYLSLSSSIGPISEDLASELWSGNHWSSGSGQYNSISWPIGDFSQNLPVDIFLEAIESDQMNIMAFMGGNWSSYSMTNSGENAPRLVVEYSGSLAPEITAISNQETNEDEPITINVIASSDSNLDLTYFAESDTSAMPVYMNGSTLAVGLEVNWSGVGNITVVVNDENGLSDSTNFMVTVNPVNDPPQDFSLIYPTLEDTIIINPDIDWTMPFYWETSNDVDSDIIYQLSVSLNYFNDIYTTDYENVTDSLTNISVYEWAVLMTNLNLPRWTLDYVVTATDGEYTVQSEAGQFVFQNTSLSVAEELTPLSYKLHQNHPNPFNPVTSLRYDLPEDALVNITIYDMIGRVINNLVTSKQTSGFKSVQWNATDNFGQPVSAGVYLYQIKTGNFTQTKKMLLLK